MPRGTLAIWAVGCLLTTVVVGIIAGYIFGGGC